VECLGYHTVYYTIWGGVLYFGERLYREVRIDFLTSQEVALIVELFLPQFRARRETRIVGVLMHPSGAMEIRFRKPSFRYKAGQWLFLNVPEVSKFQYHPFTVCILPHLPFI
jgi:NADPH oxidase 1